MKDLRLSSAASTIALMSKVFGHKYIDGAVEKIPLLQMRSKPGTAGSKDFIEPLSQAALLQILGFTWPEVFSSSLSLNSGASLDMLALKRQERNVVVDQTLLDDRALVQTPDLVESPGLEKCQTLLKQRDQVDFIYM